MVFTSKAPQSKIWHITEKIYPDKANMFCTGGEQANILSCSQS